MLTGSVDKSAGVFIAKRVLGARTESENGVFTTVALLGERDGVFRSATGEEECEIDYDQTYIDIGEDEEGDVGRHLDARVCEERINGVTFGSTAALPKILKEHRSVFPVRLGSQRRP